MGLLGLGFKVLGLGLGKDSVDLGCCLEFFKLP